MTPALVSQAGTAKLLYYIATAEEPLTVDDLAELTDASRSTVSGGVNSLWRTGLVIRRKHPDDLETRHRARYQYRLTPRGDVDE